MAHYTIQWLNCVTANWVRKIMHSSEVHSNESACRKSGRLGMEQVSKYYKINCRYTYFSNFVTMSFDYDFYSVSVQNLKSYIYFWYIYIFTEKTHSTGYSSQIHVVFISTALFNDTQFPLPPHGEHWKTEKYWGSANRSEVDLDSDINCLASGKIRPFTTVPSQCEILL